MKSDSLNSLNSLNSFSDTFSIFSFVRSSGKTIQTIQNYSESPKINELEHEQLQDNHSELFNHPELQEKKQIPEPCRECLHYEVIKIGGLLVAGCVRRLDSGPWREEWQRLPAALDRCPRATT